jgi:hypothetical protein
MGRNVVSQRTPDRSFAGLMDHLTGFSGEGASSSDPVSDFGATFRRNSKPDPAALDESLTNARNGGKAMLPVTERKPGRVTPQQDAATLSYEQALRIHGRRRSPQLPPAGRNGTSVPGRKAAFASQDDAAVVRNAASNGKPVAAPTQVPMAPAKAEASMARNGAKTNPQPTRNGKMAAPTRIRAAVENQHISTTPQGESRSSSVAGGRSGRLEQPSTTSPTRRKKPAAAGSVSKSSAKAPPSVADNGAEACNRSKSPRKGKPLGKPHRESPLEGAATDFRPQILPASTAGRGVSRDPIGPLNSAMGVVEVEPPGSPLELLHELSQLDQRRTIVSVRLTAGELACLRNRADESGISVSAYMRSCVVDADQLRAQVKHALAEMRSLSAISSEPGSALTTSGNRVGDSSARNTHGWFRQVLRPLAILFGPLFPARRSA